MALPGYLEDTAKDFATQSSAAYKTELQPSTFMGSQFVAGEDPLQTKAIAAAQAGVGAVQSVPDQLLAVLLRQRHESVAETVLFVAFPPAVWSSDRTLRTV